MKRILLVGFSVTADFKRGYAARLLETCADVDGLRLKIVGIGGIHPNNLVYLIDDLLADGYDHVIFETGTSAFRRLSKSDGDLIWPFVYLFDRVVAQGSSFSFLHLHRGDVAPATDRFRQLLRPLLAQHGAEEVDVARRLVLEGLGGAFLLDDVHVNDDGARYYAWAAGHHLADLAARASLRPAGPARVFLQREFEHVPMGTLLENGGAPPVQGRFERTGLSVGYVECEAGQELVMATPAEPALEIQGFSFLSGPRSGGLELEFRVSGRRKKYQLYDEHSYYERFNIQMTSTERPGRVLARTAPALPEVVLKKGVPDTGVRVNRLVGFCAGTVTVAQARERALAMLDAGL